MSSSPISSHRPADPRAHRLSLPRRRHGAVVRLAGGLAGALALTLSPAPSDAKAPRPAPYADLLSRDAVGAAAFTEAHPTWDGRGVVVAVLDTGVDPTVPGLRQTTTGETKVIETRDFSGEGRVELKPARVEREGGVEVLRTDDGFVRGFRALGAEPAGTQRHPGTWWLGFFREERLKNSDVRDLNRDGHTDGVFAVLAFVPPAPGPGAGRGEPLCAIDLDGDGDLSDEALRPSYRVDRKPFAFRNPDPRKDLPPVAVTVAINLDDPRDPGEHSVELHFDDGGHGTHCAGIATGHGLEGREGFDGIAPGAWVMSLKIGDNTNAGGATTTDAKRKAFRYAARWADEHGVPVVISLSYGIGSETEGEADMDRLVDELLAEHPRLVASIAAGNEGPGLSTVGTPGAARRAFTSGALVTRANAQGLWGAPIPRDAVFWFSSRGGELDKPDAVSPGAAWSSVPNFMRRAVMAGTSMATPQTSGVHALLISAAQAEKIPWSAWTLKEALKGTARPVPGATRLDQGAGLLQVPAAFDALRALARAQSKAHHLGLLLGFDASTPIPQRPGHQAPASFWRVGGFVPRAPERVTFDVHAALASRATDSQRHAFFARLALTPTVPWLRVDRRRLTLRGDAPQSVHVTVDRAKLTKPGLYVGLVRGRVEGEPVDALALPVSVVVPYRFDVEGTRQRSFRGTLAPADVHRYFVQVPPGATAMIVDFGPGGGKHPEQGDAWVQIHDPAGRPTAFGRMSGRAGKRWHKVLGARALGADAAGTTWEIDAEAAFRFPSKVRYRLDVRFVGVALPSRVPYETKEGAGPTATLRATNRFDAPVRGRWSARIVGQRRTRKLEIRGDTGRLPLTLGHDMAGVDLALTVSPEDYGRFTDIAVSLVDAQGKAVAQGGFGARFTTLTFRGAPGRYELVVRGGRTYGDREPTWRVQVRETQILAAPSSLVVEGADGDADATLYPGVATPLTLKASAPFRELPEGFVHAAELTLTERGSHKPWLTQALDLVR